MKIMIVEILKSAARDIIYRFIQVLSAAIACGLILTIFALFSYFGPHKFELITFYKIIDLELIKKNVWQLGQMLIESFFIIYVIAVTFMMLKDLFILLKPKKNKE